MPPLSMGNSLHFDVATSAMPIYRCLAVCFLGVSFGLTAYFSWAMATAGVGKALLALTLSGPSRCSGVVAGNESVAAVSQQVFVAQNVCFKQIRVTHNSKSIEVPIVTSCPACDANGLALSPAAWEQLEDVAIRQMTVAWEILDTISSSTTTTTATTATTLTTVTEKTEPPAVPTSPQEQSVGISNKPRAKVLVPAILLPLLAVFAAALIIAVVRRRRRAKAWPTAFSIYDTSDQTTQASSAPVTAGEAGKVVLSNETQAEISPSRSRSTKQRLVTGSKDQPSDPPSDPAHPAPEEDEVSALHRAMHSAGLSVQAVIATLRGNGGTQTVGRGDTRLPSYDP